MKEIAEDAEAYAKAVRHLLRIPSVTSDDYDATAGFARRCQATLRYLDAELETHCREHGCATITRSQRSFTALWGYGTQMAH